MRGVSKTLIAALAVLLLVVGLAACGGGDDSSSTAADAGSQGQSESKSSGDAAKTHGAKSRDEDAQSDNSHSSSDASDFTPKQHSDSGGGAEQFKVKGGDNSIQEFGEEADTSELDDAALALHNFLDARAESNWDAACEYMSKGIIESFEKLASQAKGIEGSDCAGILEALTNPAAKQSMKAEAEQADVRSLRTEEESAFVIYTGAEGTVFAMPMANEDGDWKVASLAGTPLM